jgi:hypothetical protein
MPQRLFHCKLYAATFTRNDGAYQLVPFCMVDVAAAAPVVTMQAYDITK